MTKATFGSVTALVPTGASVAAALAFYKDQLGFSVVWQDENGAEIARDAVSFLLVSNNNREWIENSSYSIGVTDLDALYEEYRGVPAKVGALEIKPWGRREFHMILPFGLCLQFYGRNDRA